MSKFDEALDILLESLKDPIDEHDEYHALNYVQMNKISKAIRKAQKQEKLLELYKKYYELDVKLNNKHLTDKEELGLIYDKKILDNKIKELENDNT